MFSVRWSHAGLGRATGHLSSFLNLNGRQRSSSVIAVGVSLMAAAPDGWATGAALHTPPPGSLLGGPEVTLGWTAGAGGYRLLVGTTGPGSSDVHASPDLPNHDTSHTVGGIPSGTLVHVRLECEISPGAEVFVHEDYVYLSDPDGDAVLSAIDPHPAVRSGSMLLLKRART